MKYVRYVGIFVLALVLAACGQVGNAMQTKEIEGVSVRFEHPESAELLQNYDLFVTLTQNGQPIENADVVLELDMPTMEMATNQPVAEPIGGGRYKITTAYTMEGDWTITVKATSVGKTYQATFDQAVKAK